PPTDDVIPLLQLVEQPGDVRGVVLAVAIESDDQLAPSDIEARRQRGGLPEVCSEPNDAELRQRGYQVAEAGTCRVRRAVVDNDQLVGPAEALHDAPEGGQQRPDVVLLVVDGNDDRESDAVWAAGIDQVATGTDQAGHALFSPAARRSPSV